MSYEFTCPYCFETMRDDEVHFRSERVHRNTSDILSDKYDDVEDFKARYRGDDKEELLRQLQDWDFFLETEDPVYQEFWENYNGTTEQNPADKVLKVEAYRRRILNPSDEQHRRYLRVQDDGGYLIRDPQGMVSQIELKTGERCSRRVCPHCHNPLPDNYGKNAVKFTTIIGITGAGKTVYISQLLRNMKAYAVKAGLTAIVGAPSIVTFLESNLVEADQPLPGSTSAIRFQQPLFYEMVRESQDGRKITETLVLYDVAGEVFTSPDLVNRFAPFVEHADGAIVLIDPMQFGVIQGAQTTGIPLDNPTKVLDAIHNVVTQGNSEEKCAIPFAICISKIDMETVQNVLDSNLRELLLDDVHGVQDANGMYLPLFNAAEYNPISDHLTQFFQKNEMVLAQQLHTNYTAYAYFAFTALGCRVLEKESPDGSKFRYPEGPVLPKRVEEPLLWLFHKFGYIDANQVVRTSATPKTNCPECGSQNVCELHGEDRYEVVGFFRKKRLEADYECGDCGHRWLRNSPVGTW